MSPRTPSEAPSRTRPWLRVLGRWLRLVIVLGLLATVLQSTTVLSQIGPGASLTVVRGSVSVTRSDGTAIYPAGTGLTLALGDIVGTLAQTRAIVTFFSGSEVELGSNTTIIIRRLDRDLLDQANVTVEHLTGASLIRVPGDGDANSGVRILANDTVAVVRAGEIGHGVDPTSNNVTVVCVEGSYRCSRDTVTFPNERSFLVGEAALVKTGTGDLVSLRVARGASVWDVMAEGASVGQPEGTDGPLGPINVQRERAAAQDEDDKSDQDRTASSAPAQTLTPTPTATPARTATSTPTPTPTRTPTSTFSPTPTPTPTTIPAPPGTPGAACGTPQGSAGGPGTFDFVHNLGRTSGVVQISYDALLAGDRFQMFYEGVQIFTTGDTTFVAGVGSGSAPFSGTSTFITVRVTTGPGSIVWNYSVACLP